MLPAGKGVGFSAVSCHAPLSLWMMWCSANGQRQAINRAKHRRQATAPAPPDDPPAQKHERLEIPRWERKNKTKTTFPSPLESVPPIASTNLPPPPPPSPPSLHWTFLARHDSTAEQRTSDKTTSTNFSTLPRKNHDPKPAKLADSGPPVPDPSPQPGDDGRAPERTSQLR